MTSLSLQWEGSSCTEGLPPCGLFWMASMDHPVELIKLPLLLPMYSHSMFRLNVFEGEDCD